MASALISSCTVLQGVPCARTSPCSRSAPPSLYQRTRQMNKGVSSFGAQSQILAVRRSEAFTCFAAATEEAEVVEQLQELTKDDFAEHLEANAGRLTVVDFFTNWCGPCKLIMPQLVVLSKEMPDVSFVKFNCNKYNKELGVSLGIKVAPTFQLYREGKKVAEMTGAKVEDLKALIAKHA